jgi:hypothetical protein
MADKVTFDSVNKLIICKTGVTELDVKRDLYSAGKEEWLVDSLLNKFRFPISTVGGNPTVGEQFIEPYFFLLYGWRIRPDEDDHLLTMNGNLFVSGGGNPFVATVGDFTVMVNQITTITRVTQTGGSAELSPEEHDKLMGLPGLTDIEASTILAKQAELLRAVGLMQENQLLDQTEYSTYNGVKLLTKGRIRTYTNPASIGTENDILASYLIDAVWDNDSLQSYKVTRQ